MLSFNGIKSWFSWYGRIVLILMWIGIGLYYCCVDLWENISTHELVAHAVGDTYELLDEGYVIRYKGKDSLYLSPPYDEKYLAKKIPAGSYFVKKKFFQNRSLFGGFTCEIRADVFDSGGHRICKNLPVNHCFSGYSNSGKNGELIWEIRHNKLKKNA